MTKLFDCIEDLIYQKIIELLGEFFSYMNSMGSDLFGLPWVNQIVTLFGLLGWALFVVGIIVALFDFAIESQNGRGDPKALAMNIIKGFMAASLFTVVPVKLYGLAVAMQSSMSADMTGLVSPEGSGTLLDACLGAVGDMMFGPLLNILIIIGDKGVLCKPQKRRDFADTDCCRCDVYVQYSKGLYRRFCHVGKAGNCYLFDRFFAVNHAGMRFNSVQGLLAAWLRDNACGSGDTENSGTVRT